MMGLLKNIYRRIRKKWRLILKVNWVKTLYFNYKKFPYKIARKLPVIIYGPVKLSNISGEIKIEGPISKSMIGFGQYFEKQTTSRGIAELNIQGTLVFKSNAHIGKDFFIYIAKDAYCEFGYMGCLGSSVKLICTHKVVIGNWAGIGYESQIIDSTLHPMMNKETGEHYPKTGPVIIGNYNSFSNRISIMPNTVTPDHCVIASNSLCNKDYTSLGNYILIGGIPAKLIKNNYARDWESEKEALLRNKIIEW
jgi:acetyltransferase-like isoleucine patch superfamily enzyme